MSTLRTKAIRLAASDEELRTHLLPLLERTAAPGDEEVQWDRRLLSQAASAIAAEADALKAVQAAFADWKGSHKKASEAMSKIREDMDKKYDNRVWRDLVTSAFSGATWYGLDVKDFFKHMTEADKALGGTYGSLGEAQRILDDIKRVS